MLLPPCAHALIGMRGWRYISFTAQHPPCRRRRHASAIAVVLSSVTPRSSCHPSHRAADYIDPSSHMCMMAQANGALKRFETLRNDPNEEVRVRLLKRGDGSRLESAMASREGSGQEEERAHAMHARHLHSRRCIVLMCGVTNVSPLIMIARPRRHRISHRTSTSDRQR